MSWATPRTWVATEIVTASNMNTALRDQYRHLSHSTDASDALPQCIVYYSTNATSDGWGYQAPFDSETIDTHGMWGSSTGDRVYLTQPGIYYVSFYAYITGLSSKDSVECFVVRELTTSTTAEIVANFTGVVSTGRTAMPFSLAGIAMVPTSGDYHLWAEIETHTTNFDADPFTYDGATNGERNRMSVVGLTNWPSTWSTAL